MAEIFSNEGLDVIMGIFPKNGTNVTQSWLGLFTSQTATTVPAATAVLSTSTGVTEATGTAYARPSIAAASWGAQAAGSPDGRKTTAGVVTFATVGAGGWGTLNGFFWADAVSAGHAYGYANFDSGLAINSSVGDVITVTPTYNMGA